MMQNVAKSVAVEKSSLRRGEEPQTLESGCALPTPRLLDSSTAQLLKKGRPVRLRAYQAGLWGCYIIPDGSVGLLVASDRYETLETPGSCPHDRGLRPRQEHPPFEVSVGCLSLPRAPNLSSWATAMASAFRVPSPPLAPP